MHVHLCVLFNGNKNIYIKLEVLVNVLDNLIYLHIFKDMILYKIYGKL